MSIPTNATKQDIEACSRVLFAKTTETARCLLLGHVVQMSDESLMKFAQVLQHEGKISDETGNLLPEGWFRLAQLALHDHDGVHRSIASIEGVNRCSLGRTLIADVVDNLRGDMVETNINTVHQVRERLTQKIDVNCHKELLEQSRSVRAMVDGFRQHSLESISESDLVWIDKYYDSLAAIESFAEGPFK